MIQAFANVARPLLEHSLIRRVRRNHALEHATVHMLTRKLKNLRVAGRASDSGFVLMGDIPTDAVEKAAHEALTRLQRGEHKLAIHPNCGTNLVTTGVMSTMAATIGLSVGSNTRRFSADRFSLTLMLTILALIVSQPLGMRIQELITTKGDPGDLEIIEINRREINWFGHKMVMHHIATRRG
ncbi:MAG: hypothetical protein CUN56_07435 [Phototrophicales bacterium]|nr:MAG: hypothetical protein CUN56_07435 [Phototrophicales bacterium]RMG76404.1 MAG: hypothetical protein D6711_04010 [Chloroflexota bacterium]